ERPDRETGRRFALHRRAGDQRQMDDSARLAPGSPRGTPQQHVPLANRRPSALRRLPLLRRGLPSRRQLLRRAQADGLRAEQAAKENPRRDDVARVAAGQGLTPLPASKTSRRPRPCSTARPSVPSPLSKNPYPKTPMEQDDNVGIQRRQLS